MSERQLASLAPSYNRCFAQGEVIVFSDKPLIYEQIVLYLKTAIFNFLTGQHPTRFIRCFYFVHELNPNTGVKFNTIHSLLAALNST